MFVMRSTYDALQRECDALAERCERERERHATAIIDEAKRYDQSVQFLQERNTWWAERYERERKTNRALVKQLIELKKEGFAPPRTQDASVQLPPIDDASRVMSAQRNMAIDSAAADFRARGMSADVALDEATRTIDSIFMPIAGDFQ